MKKSFFLNLSWIFGGNVVHAILNFLLSIVAARFLTRADYGAMNYAIAWVALYNSIASLGFNSVINKYTTDDIEESNVYLWTAIIGRCVASIFGIIVTVVTVYYVNNKDAKILGIAFIQALTMLFGAGDTLVYWFRYKREANIAAKLRILSLLISACIRIISVIVLKSAFFYVLGLVVEAGIFSFLLIIEYRRRYTYNFNVSIFTFKKLLTNSYPFIFSTILSTVYIQTDRIMLNNMLGSEAVANYSIACTVAGMMSVIVSAIIEGFRPEILKFVRDSHNQYLLLLRQVYSITFWLTMGYGVLITLFSKQLLHILYGAKYIEASSALALVVWYTSFSYFGAINNIYMVAENKEKWVQVTTLIGAGTNIAANWFLIPIMGTIGAALASLLTQFLANFLVLFFIPDMQELPIIIVTGIIDLKSIHVDRIIKKLQVFFKNSRK